MSLTASAPPLFPDGPHRPRRPWRRPAFWVSLSLHVAVLVVLLLSVRPRPLPTPAAPEGVEVVFESTQPAQEAQEAPAAEAPAPMEPPDPQARPLPPVPPPMAAPPPAPAPPAPSEPSPAEPAPPVPQPAQPEPAPRLPEVPEAEVPPPTEPLPELDTHIDLARPTPLQLNPPPPPTPPRAEPAPPRPASPFAGTIDLGRSAPITLAPQPAPRRRPSPGQGMEMAIGPVPERSLAPRRYSPTSNSVLSYVSGARPTVDWSAAFQRWVQQRAFYPSAAAQRGEDGAVVLRVTVQKDGTISAVRIITSSGSRWLDSASLSYFRDQVGPAFPPEMREGQDSITLNFTTYYILH